jgi:PadR family transcriptional regulator, regulatory protein PadR
MEALDVSNWQSQLKKGLLDTVILNLVGRARCHGYDIARRLKGIAGLSIREGNIYPILARLEADGLVASTRQQSQEGPPRKYYEITELGRKTVEEMNRHWDQMNESVQRIRKENVL